MRGMGAVTALAGLVIATQGCAAGGLTLLGVGAGTTVSTGTAYTLDGVAYRTFAAPVGDVRRATSVSLKRMDVRVKTDRATDSGREIEARAGDRTVAIAQTERALDDLPALSQRRLP